MLSVPWAADKEPCILPMTLAYAPTQALSRHHPRGRLIIHLPPLHQSPASSLPPFTATPVHSILPSPFSPLSQLSLRVSKPPLSSSPLPSLSSSSAPQVSPMGVKIDLSRCLAVAASGPNAAEFLATVPRFKRLSFQHTSVCMSLPLSLIEAAFVEKRGKSE